MTSYDEKEFYTQIPPAGIARYDADTSNSSYNMLSRISYITPLVHSSKQSQFSFGHSYIRSSSRRWALTNIVFNLYQWSSNTHFVHPALCRWMCPIPFVSESHDRIKFHEDLIQINSWNETWLMPLNTAIRDISSYSYSIDNYLVNSESCYMYLGSHLSSNHFYN